MSNPNTLARRIRSVLTVLVIAGGAITATATAAAADDVHHTCKSGTGYVICFDIARLGVGNSWTVHIGIDVIMSQADAESILAPPGDEFSGKVRGSDPVFDNTEFNMFLTGASAWSNGLSADFHRTASGDLLNEDPEGGDDELYGRVLLFDHRTGKTRTFDSNKINHNFHP